MQAAANPPPTLPRCLLIATGGTLAMTVSPARGAARPALAGEDLLARTPGCAQHAQLEVLDLFNLPSVEIGPAEWLALQRAIVAATERPDIAGIVVTHGTDTLEETAWLVELTVATSKPIVFVGAQRNASEADSDGPRNLLAGVRVCADREAADRGVLVVLNDTIHAAREVSKGHTSNIASFDSGPLGAIGMVEPDRVRFRRHTAERAQLPLGGAPLPRVDIVPMYPGADGALMQAAVAAGARGVVLQALGAGNVNGALLAAARDAIEAGVALVVASRVPRGRVWPGYGFAGGGRSLREAGAVLAGDLSPQKARVLLMLALQADMSRSQIEWLFER